MTGSLEQDIYNIKKENEKYKVELKVPMEKGFIENVNLILDNTYYPLYHRENKDGYAIFENIIEIETKAIYHFKFGYKTNGNYRETKTNKISINFEVPDWAKGKIMYHIFVDRFKRNGGSFIDIPGRIKHKNWDEKPIIGPDENGIWNNDFYGGNIKGIIDSLDYIKSLGVSIIYLSPIFESSSNHRYDTANYEKIDPYVGNEEDLKELCEKAHKNNIKIILDGVFNHTGNDSKYFNEYGRYETIGAYQSTDSPYTPFYRKTNGKFDYWWGMKNLPVCDGTSKAWQDYIYGEGGIIDKWFKLGIDGLRLDVADELTDEFIEGIRRAVKRNKKDGFILGEVWKNPMRMNRNYISSGKGMDSVMNYLLIDSLIRYLKYEDTEKIKDIIDQILTEYPKDTILSLMNFTSTHDISRIINILGTDRFKIDGQWAWDLIDEDYKKNREFKMNEEEYRKGKELYELYLFILTFLPGNLSIFYGDEVGLEGEGNLSNRKPYPTIKDREILRFIRWIGKIRERENTLEQADLNIIQIDQKIMMFERIKEEISYLTYINRSDEERTITIPKQYENPKKIYTIKKSNIKTLKPKSGITLKRQKG